MGMIKKPILLLNAADDPLIGEKAPKTGYNIIA